eukprot:TRINITY_DN15304_c0_g1_i1.p3 TRINITY_DN15304_c0_g1~~TRINITY_DN15304_c0_g1_i1.p3  ORF type:complete len:140 (+),score=26.77 TRINITY_DN15304_c0_g1_i1:322-741(+)
MTAAALAIIPYSSTSRDMVSKMVELRQVKLFSTPRVMVVVDGDGRNSVSGVLGHDVGFLQTDDQLELLAGVRQAVDQTLQLDFCVGCQGCIISGQQLMDVYLAHFGYGSESNSDKLAVVLSLKVDALGAVSDEYFSSEK